MTEYIEIVKYTLSIISETYLFFFIGAFVIFLAFIIFRKKLKTSTYKWGKNLGLIFMCVVVVEFAILAIPRVLDITQRSFIVVPDAQFYVTATQGDGAEIFYGNANVDTSDGKTVSVFGINFFDLEVLNLDEVSPTMPDTKYFGTAVYAKHSRQIIRFVTSDSENLLKLPE